jgi:hypothetical protein
MPKKPKEFRLSDTFDLPKQATLKTPTSAQKMLPPLSRRQAKVDWTEVMKMRHQSVDLAGGDTGSFYYDQAFDSFETTNHQRFYSKNLTEEVVRTPDNVTKASQMRRLRERFNHSVDISQHTPPGQNKLGCGLSLIKRVDEEERKASEDAASAETLDKIHREKEVWDECYAELDTVTSTQERAVAARRIAHNSQKLLGRVLSVYEQHSTHCSKNTEAMKSTIKTLQREVILALKLKEALVVKSLDKERLRMEIEAMYDNGDDFNYESFTSSARKLLDRGESQLTYFLLEAYNELCRERIIPEMEDDEVVLESFAKWEHEMMLKFT